jgi:hypothetical protein
MYPGCGTSAFQVDVLRASVYKNGSGVAQMIKRLEQEAVENEDLCAKPTQLKSPPSSVES